MSGKNLKIWGVRSGGLGDLVEAEPILRYLEKKYPNSYKYYVINRKCCQLAPAFINHPLIDKLYVTEWWDAHPLATGLSPKDQAIKNSCDIIINESPPVLDQLWYNKYNTVDCVFLMAGIEDYKSVLTDEELVPKLYKWFPDPSVSNNPKNTGYSQIETKSENRSKIRIGVHPFAKYGEVGKRNPSKEWWEAFLSIAKDYFGDAVEFTQFGWVTDPDIGAGITMNMDSYFEQIRQSLECDLILGTDSGTMWVIGAYGIPAISLMTYHYPNHVSNETAFYPVNKNGRMIFNPKGTSAINLKLVLNNVEDMINGK